MGFWRRLGIGFQPGDFAGKCLRGRWIGIALRAVLRRLVRRGRAKPSGGRKGHCHFVVHWGVERHLDGQRGDSHAHCVRSGIAAPVLLFGSHLAVLFCCELGNRQFLVHQRYRGHRTHGRWASAGIPSPRGGWSGHFRRLFWRQTFAVFRHHQLGSGDGRYRPVHPHPVHAVHHRTQLCRDFALFCGVYGIVRAGFPALGNELAEFIK